jgi:hypothetical protein
MNSASLQQPPKPPLPNLPLLAELIAGRADLVSRWLENARSCRDNLDPADPRSLRHAKEIIAGLEVCSNLVMELASARPGKRRIPRATPQHIGR